MKRSTLSLLPVALLLALGGCAAGPASAPGAPASQAPFFGGWFGSGLSPALEAQRDRLQEALRGTPVVVEATGDQRLRVAVPARHAFDPGRAAVKPALGAVLDQLAIGFKPYAATTELHIAAPDDDKANERLVKSRGASVREHLIGRGVPASRIAGTGGSDTDGIEILIKDRPLDGGRSQ